MIRNITTRYFLYLLLLVLASCSEELSPNAYNVIIMPEASSAANTLSLSVSTLSFASSGGSEDIRVTTDAEPSYIVAESSESWLTITRTNNKLTITASENTSPSSRSATITVSIKKLINRTLSQTITVTQEGTGGVNNGYEYVDLGLSVMWATCNVGATSPEGYGDYFAWGETKPKSDYSWSTYFDSVLGGRGYKKYATNQETVLELTDDAAHVNWGSTWRMPTYDEQEELRTKCTWTWTTMNGVSGYEVKNEKNGNSIFLPAAGYRYALELLADKIAPRGFYWSSSLYKSYSDYAWNVDFGSGHFDSRYYNRCRGHSVRPVCPSGSISQTTCSFSTSSHTLNIGDIYTQTVTTNSDGAVTYTSSNPSVATVNASTGKVTAVAEGTATITATIAATDTYASASATYSIVVQKSSTSTHEYVDLGLSVKWATCNVGATSPEGYGDYFAWGETKPKSDYSWSTYFDSNFSKYATNKQTVLELTDDAAHVNWGGNWRMPTDAELTELRTNCQRISTAKSGVEGYEVKSKTNGNSIFLPVAGYRYGKDRIYGGYAGYYWASTIYNSNYAYDIYLNFYENFRYDNRERYYGQSVRPVCP